MMPCTLYGDRNRFPPTPMGCLVLVMPRTKLARWYRKVGARSMLMIVVILLTGAHLRMLASIGMLSRCPILDSMCRFLLTLGLWKSSFEEWPVPLKSDPKTKGTLSSVATLPRCFVALIRSRLDLMM